MVITLLLLIGLWVLLMLLLSGVGQVAIRVIGATGTGQTAAAPLTAFWMGYAVCLGAAQWYHLVAPVNWGLRLGLIALGLFGIARTPWGQYRVSRALLPVLALAGLLMANQALLPMRTGSDTVLYHLGLVQWADRFAAVPGLANIHFRFGFFSSHFVFGALFNVGPFEGRAAHLLTGLFGFAYAVGVMAVSRSSHVSRDAPLEYDRVILIIGLLPVLLVTMMWANTLYVLPAAFPLAFVLMAHLVRLERNPDRVSFAAVSMLAAALVSLKLGYLVMGVGAQAAAFWLARGNRLKWKWMALVAAAAWIAVAAPYFIRRGIVTGYPLFPSPWLAWNVDWAVPRESVIAIRDLVTTWARAHNGEAGGIQWVGPWLLRQMRQETDWLLGLIPIALALVSWAASRRLRVHPVVLMPWILAVPYWFLFAPDFRFSGALFWIILAAVVPLSVTTRIARNPKHVAVSLLVAVLLLKGLYSVASTSHFGAFAAGQIPELPTPSATKTVSEHGVVVRTPSDPRLGTACWNLPQPCTATDVRCLAVLDSSGRRPVYRHVCPEASGGD